MMRPYRVRLLRAPHTEWDVLASNMSEAKAKVLADEPRLKWIDLGVSVPGGDFQATGAMQANDGELPPPEPSAKVRPDGRLKGDL